MNLNVSPPQDNTKEINLSLITSNVSLAVRIPPSPCYWSLYKFQKQKICETSSRILPLKVLIYLTCLCGKFQIIQGYYYIYPHIMCHPESVTSASVTTSCSQFCSIWIPCSFLPRYSEAISDATATANPIPSLKIRSFAYYNLNNLTVSKIL